MIKIIAREESSLMIAQKITRRTGEKMKKIDLEEVNESKILLLKKWLQL